MREQHEPSPTTENPLLRLDRAISGGASLTLSSSDARALADAIAELRASRSRFAQEVETLSAQNAEHDHFLRLQLRFSADLTREIEDFERRERELIEALGTVYDADEDPRTTVRELVAERLDEDLDASARRDGAVSSRWADASDAAVLATAERALFEVTRRGCGTPALDTALADVRRACRAEHDRRDTSGQGANEQVEKTAKLRPIRTVAPVPATCGTCPETHQATMAPATPGRGPR